MAIKPIKHDLEYDSNYVTSTLDDVDVTFHYAELLKDLDQDQIKEYAECEDVLIEDMRGIFENDHSLLDSGDLCRPWTAYGLDLIDDLSKSLGLDADGRDPVELVALWLQDPIHTVNAARQSTTTANALQREVSFMLTNFAIEDNPDLLVTLFRTLLSTKGAFGALTTAICECGTAEPTGALRAAAELEKRRS